MKIEIPHFATEIEDEGVIVFLAFMLRMTKGSNNTRFGNGYKGIRYYIHSSDVRYMLARYIVSPERIHDDIYTWCRIGKASDKIWMFEWKGHVRTEHYELKDPHFFGIWGYLLGRDYSDQLVTDANRRIPEGQPTVITSAKDRACFAYVGQK